MRTESDHPQQEWIWALAPTIRLLMIFASKAEHYRPSREVGELVARSPLATPSESSVFDDFCHQAAFQSPRRDDVVAWSSLMHDLSLCPYHLPSDSQTRRGKALLYRVSCLIKVLICHS